MAATQAIDILRPVPRNAGIQIPNLVPASRWIDARVLGAGVAESHTLPTDSAGHKGTIVGITATDGPLYINFAGTAAAPSGDVITGTASLMLRTDTGASYLLSVPVGTTAISLICANAATVTLEFWN